VKSERYNFSNEMKLKAHKRAELFCPEKSKNVHHIVPKYTSNKYNIPTCLVRKDENAIALERDFHSWIHGNRLNTTQLAELLGDEMTELDRLIDDNEIEWKGFTEDDYIFLAVALLGIDENYFNQQRVYQKKRKPKKKRRKNRHR
jgi:hypothetical protein